MTVKVVVNRCCGGFGLSSIAANMIEERLGCKFNTYSHPRHCPVLVSIVESLGDQASGSFAELDVQELKGNKYIIRKYDGAEWIEEPADINWIVVKENNKVASLTINRALELKI